MASEDADMRTPAATIHWRRIVLAVLFFLLLVLGLIAWVVGTSGGARASFHLLALVTGGQIQANDIRGNLISQLEIGHLDMSSKDGRITISQLKLHWQPVALRDRLLLIKDLHLGQLIIVQLKQPETKPQRPPASLQLPFQIILDHLRIDHLRLRQEHQEQMTMAGLHLRWRFDGQSHTLNLLSAHLTQLAGQRTDGRLSASLHLQAIQPFALQSHVTLEGKQDDWQLQGKGEITGVLTDMTLRMNMRFGRSQAQTTIAGQIRLQPFSDQVLRTAELKAEQLDLAVIHSGWPHTRIDAQVFLKPHQQGKFVLRNTLPGTLDKGRLPVAQASGRFRLRDEYLAIEDLNINNNTLRANLQRQHGQWQASVTAQGLNLANIDSRLRATHLQGDVHLTQVSKQTLLKIALSEPLKKKSLHLRAEASLQDSLLKITAARISLGNAVATITGQAVLSGLQQFDLHVQLQRLHLSDVGKFDPLPDILLTGHFDLKGKRAPPLQMALDFSVTDSRIGRHAFDGEGKVQLDGQSLDMQRLRLRAGDNSLQAHGTLQGEQGELNLILKAPRLSQLGSSLAGQLNLTALVKGSLAKPALTMQWQARDLGLTGQWSVRDTQGRIALGSTSSSPLSLQTELRQAVIAGTALSSIRVDLEGQTAAHKMFVTLATPAHRLQLSASGGLDSLSTRSTWRGQLLQASIAGEINAALEQSAAIEWSGESLQIRDLQLAGDIGRLVINHFHQNPKQIISRGQVERLHIGRLASATGMISLAKSDLQLAGDWNLQSVRQDLRNTEGLITLRRTCGDLRLSEPQLMPLELQQLEAQARLSAGRLSVRLDARGDQLGSLHFAGGTQLGHLTSAPRGDAPIDGVLRANLPALTFLGPMISPALMTAGRLEARISVAGSLSSPSLAGTISGKQLQIRWIDKGLNLHDGLLQADFNGDLLQVRELSFAGSGDSTGRISVNGPVRFSDGAPVSDLRWRAARFSPLNRRDRQLLLSGSGQLQTGTSSVQLRGDLMVDRGFIDLGPEEMPQLSDDVVVVDKPPKATEPLTMDIDLGVGLGDQLTVRGRGIDARIGGTLRIKSAPGEALSARGLMQVTRGTYTAYGRELVIERGLLRFDGPPGNPSLDIRAMRRGTAVEPGVMITGRVLAPRIRLVSEPQVPDAEKLSWLVLGQGLSGTTDKQAGVLQDAAASLLTQSAAAGVQSQIAGSLGLDSITVSRRPDNVQQRIITLGKRVSSRLYVSYQQGLQAAGSVILLRYTLSPRVTVEAETGTRSVFSLFYNFSFD